MDTQSENTFEIFTYTGETTLVGAKKFNSGNEAIDKYAQKGNIKQLASKAPGNGVKVLLDNSQKNRLAGYVTIAAYSLRKEVLQGKVENVGTTRDIPVVRLVMLGVDQEYQGKGLGHKLLRVAFDSTKAIAQQLNCSGLYLDAAPDAVKFYEKFNFVALDDPYPETGIVPMFLHLGSIP